MSDHVLRLAGIVEDSIVDGPGLRMVLFAQGCRHKCPGCHNPHTHEFEGGTLWTVQDIVARVKKNPLLDGVTLSGGDPFEQADAFAVLSEAVRKMGLHVMTYTGYTYEELMRFTPMNPGWEALLKETDVLVDGRFIAERHNMRLRFRGSDNQRLICMQSTRAAGRIVCLEEEMAAV